VDHLSVRLLLMAVFVGTMAMSIATPAVSLESEGEKDYSGLPGFVDIKGLGVFSDEDATVEVYLDEKLLGMVAEMARSAEPELSEVLLGLNLVRVQRYRMRDNQLDQVEKKTADMAGKLEGQDWMRVVRIRERDETVYVYFKLGEKLVHGITVMVIEEYDGYATFVNIVGDIDPAQVGRIGRKFNIDALDMDWNDFEDLDRMRDRDDRRDKDRRDEQRDEGSPDNR
jgi:hypothetical protein